MSRSSDRNKSKNSRFPLNQVALEQMISEIVSKYEKAKLNFDDKEAASKVDDFISYFENQKKSDGPKILLDYPSS